MASWSEYSEKFDGLSQREKLLSFSAGLVVIFLVGFTFGVESLWVNNNEMRTELVSLDTQITNLKLQQQTYSLALKSDPNTASKAQLAQIQKRYQRIDADFSKELHKLVPPSSMPALMASVLGLSKNLNLIEMKAIEPVDLSFKENEKSLGLYQHGVRMVFNSNYSNAQNFLESLEQTQWQVYWDVMTFHVQTYPNATLIIEFYTLSTEKVFIRV